MNNTPSSYLRRFGWIAAILALMLVGCGGSSNSSPDPEDPDQPNTPDGSDNQTNDSDSVAAVGWVPVGEPISTGRLASNRTRLLTDGGGEIYSVYVNFENSRLRVSHLGNNGEWDTNIGKGMGASQYGRASPAVAAGSNGLTLGYLTELSTNTLEINSYTANGFGTAEAVALAEHALSYAAAASEADTRYIAMADWQHNIRIWKSEGTSLNPTYIEGPLNIKQAFWDLAIANSQPHLAYLDTADAIKVVRHTAGGWQEVASINIDSTNNVSLGLASGGDKLYLKVQRQLDDGYKISVYDLTTTTPTALPMLLSGESWVDYAELHVNESGTPMVAWVQGARGPTAERELYFARHSAQGWVKIGGGYIDGFNNSSAYRVSSALIDNIPHVQFQPWDTTQLIVMRHDEE